MENYIALLNEENLRYVCNIIGGKGLRGLYKNNPKPFNKISKFRPDSLSDEKAVDFAVSHINERFVGNFVNDIISSWMQEIQEEIDNKQANEESEAIWLADVLSRSFFSKKPEVYFILSKSEPPIADTAVFYHMVEQSRTIYEQTHHIKDNACTSSEDDISSVQQILAEQDSELLELCESYEKQLSEDQTEMAELQARVSWLESDLRKKENECALMNAEIEKYQELASHESVAPEMIPSEGFHFLSLCQVYEDYDRIKLHRLTDVRNGVFSTQYLSEVPSFSYLNKKGGPDKTGYVGVWDCKTVPNKYDRTKEYIETSFHATINPIELLLPSDCQTVEELIEKLKTGIAVQPHADILFVAVSNGNNYEGLLCDNSYVCVNNDTVSLKEGIRKLPIYEVRKGGFIPFDSVSIYETPSIGFPKKMIRVNDPIEVVRQVVVNRATWTALKQIGMTKAEHSKIRDFLKAIPVTELVDEISRSCDCTTEEAKAFIEDFRSRAETYVDGATLENEIAAQIIRNDDELYHICLEEINKDWENANQQKIDAAQSELDRIKTEEKECLAHCEEVQENISQLNKELDVIQAEIDAKEQLAIDVENKVADKIEQARKNAAEFIAENAFIHPDSAIHSTDTCPENKTTEDERVCQRLFSECTPFQSDDPDINDTYDQLLETIQGELCEAGVEDRFALGLASVLYSAYVNRIPVLLAGPNGTEIANAFQIAMNCHFPATLKCDGDYSPADIADCEASSADLVVIENFIHPEWKMHIVDLISKRNKMYVLVHPFAEDLVIEPRGLFNYCVPILTELFVDSIPNKNYIGGILSEGFQHFVPVSTEGIACDEKMCDALRIGSLARANIQRLAADSHVLLQSEEFNRDYRCLWYPLAYVLGEKQALSDYLESTEQNDAVFPMLLV